MAEPRQPDEVKSAKAGIAPGETPNTDSTRKPDRPVEEEDTFGGAERTRKGKDLQSQATKP